MHIYIYIQIHDIIHACITLYVYLHIILCARTKDEKENTYTTTLDENADSVIGILIQCRESRLVAFIHCIYYDEL